MARQTHSRGNGYYATIEEFLETVFSTPWAPGRFGVTHSLPCGGGVEYLHRSPASRRRRRKGNPVPGDINGPPCSWGIYVREPVPPGWGSLEFETVKCGHQFRGSRTWEWQCWRGPAGSAVVPVILLRLLVVTILKWSMNPLSNPKPRRHLLIHATILTWKPG
jgi:hypothetical protein